MYDGVGLCLYPWRERPLWQLIIGSGLSMLVVMTRQNMAVVPPLLIAYIFWQYGKRAGWWALITSAVIFIGFHVLTGPYLATLVAVVTAFSNTISGLFSRCFNRQQWFNVDAVSRLQSLATGIHDHFFVLCGAISA